MSDLLYSGTNDAHILFDIGEVERNVKLQKSVSDVTDNILFGKRTVFSEEYDARIYRNGQSRKMLSFEFLEYSQ